MPSSLPPVAAASLGQGFNSFLLQQRNPSDKADAPTGETVDWPLLLGFTRVYRDRHWASDVLAGWIAGTAVAAASALLYAGLRTHAAGPAPASEGEGNNRMVALQPQASQ